MCDIREETESTELKLIAPCGKEVLLTLPDVFEPRAEDEDIGAALGSLMRALGYGRRGWTIEATKTTRKASNRRTDSTTTFKQYLSR